VSRERVRQIEAEALTKLRASQDTKKLKEYLTSLNCLAEGTLLSR
jgi:DNA-directed RNA polymerase sigma subunit (sigma70/sigma32)